MTGFSYCKKRLTLVIITCSPSDGRLFITPRPIPGGTITSPYHRPAVAMKLLYNNKYVIRNACISYKQVKPTVRKITLSPNACIVPCTKSKRIYVIATILLCSSSHRSVSYQLSSSQVSNETFKQYTAYAPYGDVRLYASIFCHQQTTIWFYLVASY